MQSKRAPVPAAAGSSHSPGHSRPLLALTDTQHAIMRMLVQGHAVEDMALVLDTRPRIVVFHKRELMRLFGVSNEAGLIEVATSSERVHPSTRKPRPRSVRACGHEDVAGTKSVPRSLPYRLLMRKPVRIPVPAAVDDDAPTRVFGRRRSRD